MKALVSSGSRIRSEVCPKCCRQRRAPLRNRRRGIERGRPDSRGEGARRQRQTGSKGKRGGGFALAAGGAATDSSGSQPYGPLEWRDEAVATSTLGEESSSAASQCRSMLIGPGATHIIEALSLSNAVVIDTNPRSTLKLPFAEPSTLGNEPGIRVWKGNFTDIPDYLAPFDQIIMASCFGSEWSQLEQQEKDLDGGEFDFEGFLDAWLSKCTDLLRPGGVVVFQELQLQDNSRSERMFEKIRKAALERHPLQVMPLESSSFIGLRMPEDYAFRGSPVRLKSRVVHGFKRGSKQLGFPTANLHVKTIEDQIKHLKKGVYFGWAKVIFKDKSKSDAFGKQPRRVVVNVGARPSFDDGSDITIEVHIINYEDAEDFYGEEMRVVLLGFIRPEMKFQGIQDLIGRIKRDIGIGSKQLEGAENASFQADAFVNGRNVAYSKKAFEINAKWTRTEPLMGWRHFRIVGEKKDENRNKMLEVMAVCDKEKRCWVDRKTLKKDSKWQPGWIDCDEFTSEDSCFQGK